MKARYAKYFLKFIRPAGTSRGILYEKESYFIRIEDEVSNQYGIGECGLLRGLSFDDRLNYEAILIQTLKDFNSGKTWDDIKPTLQEWPSIFFGIETAMKSLYASDPFALFDNSFSQGRAGIEINGLVWMGDFEFMSRQIEEKIHKGYNCIKLKIGALDFEKELALIQKIRKSYAVSDIEIRMDANGAFLIRDALDKLKELSKYQIHSIEQPIAPKQHRAMAQLCLASPIPIALDEELIGVIERANKESLLETIKPAYLILKPSFLGGFEATSEWINLAKERSIGYWLTSALESNIGLNAISQYAYSLASSIPQGLGTGSLYSNNIPSPLHIVKNHICINSDAKWDLSQLKWIDVC